MVATHPLPREILKWLQSLDLTFVVRNPKRDLSNGFIIAEIMSRYFPKDVNILTYENGTRLAAKVDNWEQVFKVINKKVSSGDMAPIISKADIDPVVHCADGYAINMIFKLYTALTKRQLKFIAPKVQDTLPPGYMRETAAKRMKDPEIARVADNMERTIKAIDTLGAYHERRRAIKAEEAPTLMMQERQRKLGVGREKWNSVNRDEADESVHIDEVTVKALAGGIGDTQQARGLGRGRANTTLTGIPQQAAIADKSARAKLLRVVTCPKSSVGALALLQHPAHFVKPAVDIMRPVISSVVQEHDEFTKGLDPRKDLVVSFMERCSSRDGIPEDVAAKVFETLAQRAHLLGDTLTKSPQEFWKVWSTFSPALVDFPESSILFESVVFFFRRLGELIKDSDPSFAQQLMMEVALPSIGGELTRSPEKREALCELMYCYTQHDTMNHLLMLRALKDSVKELPVYAGCLACLVSVDAKLGLLDEHLLDLYIYYALIATQSPQPKVRVAGISTLTTVTIFSTHPQGILGLSSVFVALSGDEWWEVQAQLLMLCANLLSKITSIASPDDADNGQDEALYDADSASRSALNTPSVRGGGFGGLNQQSDLQDIIVGIIGRVFVVSNSKNVLQVGLCSLVRNLFDYPVLLPMYVAVLLRQPPELRDRLLVKDTAMPPRLAYVSGSSSRMYEEICISAVWPAQEIAKTLVMQFLNAEVQRLELDHATVLLATLPESFMVDEVGEWLVLFDKMKHFLVFAFIEPSSHLPCCQILKRFWCSEDETVAQRSLEASKKSLIEALILIYDGTDVVIGRDHGQACVEEAAVIHFLLDLVGHGGNTQLEITSVVESFKDMRPAAYAKSRLNTVFA